MWSGPRRGVFLRTFVTGVVVGPAMAWLCLAALSAGERGKLVTLPFLWLFLAVTMPFALASGVLGGAAAVGLTRAGSVLSSRAAWLTSAAAIGAAIGVLLVIVTMLVVVGLVDPRNLDPVVRTYMGLAAVAGALTGATAGIATWPIVSGLRHTRVPAMVYGDQRELAEAALAQERVDRSSAFPAAADHRRATREASGLTKQQLIDRFGPDGHLCVAAFIGGIAVFMLWHLPQINAVLLTKAMVAVLSISLFGFLIATLMWSRYWRRVQWETGWWSFVAGPAPEYEDAFLAWRWGRRARACWIATMVSVFAVPAIEALARH